MRPASAGTLPLFAWAIRHLSALRRAAPPPVRVVLLHGCPDEEGQPRPALMGAGRRTPVVFPTIAAALAAKKLMEAASHGR
jgi:hypothetical protein